MAAKRKYSLSDEDILTKVDGKVQGCISWTESKLSKERERVQKYYDQQLPAKQSEGNSSYVSSDVYDASESMKAQLLEVFSGGHDLVRFQPYGPEDVELAQQETKYVNDVIWSQNNGWGICHDAIDDGLKGRVGLTEVYWDERYEYDEHDFDDLTLEEVEALAAQDDIELEAELDADDYDELKGPKYSGWWRRKIDKCQVVIEPVPPEEFFIDGRVKNREEGTRGRRTPKTKADLLAMGFPKAKVDKLPTGESDLNLSVEENARFRDVDSGSSVETNESQDELQTVMLFECYTKLALHGDGKAALYRVIYADKVLFKIEEVDEDPYVEFRPLRRPHSWHGNNFAARVIPTQNAATVLTRGVLDHTAITTNPRWQVLNGTLTNPRELLDNRLGGAVNVKQRDGIAPLQYPNLNPHIFSVLEMLKQKKEENTGISSLSQGMNKDAISTQNSEGLVDNLVSLSQVRQKQVARAFANDYLAELYLKVRRIVRENEKRERIIEVTGSFVQVVPNTWAPERKVRVSFHLGYGEQDKEAAKYAQLWGMLSKDPTAQKFFSPEKQHKLLSDGMEKNGFPNFADYIVTPQELPPPPPPDPLKMKELENQGLQAQAALITAQANAKKVEQDGQLGELKLMLEQMKTEITAMKAQRDADRQDMDTANRIDVAQREMELIENAPPESSTNIASPNS